MAQQKPVTADDWTTAKPITSDDWEAAKSVEVKPNAKSLEDISFFDLDPMEQKRQLLVGAAKGAANTAIGLGELVHKIPGVSAAIDAFYGTPGLSASAFPAAREAVKPQTTGESIGQGAEQMAEFFLPTGVAGKAGKIAEVAKSGLITQVQTGSPTTSAVSAGLTAVLPGAGAAGRMANRFEAGAEKNVVRALAPTKEWAKSTAADIAPEMLERGIKGNRAQMLEQATTEGRKIGQQIGTEVAAAAQRGETVSGVMVRGAIGKARQTLMAEDANGVMRAIPGTETVLKRLDKMDRFVKSLGPDIPIDKAQRIRQVWDQIVSKAGLYGQKVGASSTDAATAWATREGASAFRKLINTGNPTLEALNKEYAFWKGLKNVLGETEKRTQAHGAGLSSTILAGTGATIGMLSGDSVSDRMEKAVFGGVAARQMTRLFSSPAFLTRISAPMKNMLADALASGNAARAETAFKVMLKSLPSEVRQSIESESK